MNTTLNNLKIGQKAKILSLKANITLKKRFVDMGFTKGSLIEVERLAPLGDPIEVIIKGYHLSLRKEEAEGIEVEVVS
ncbi:MAG: ferrous iron transport protein A [Alphaproteobacteria bacterium]